MDLRNGRSIGLVENEHSISLCTRSLLLMQLPLTNPSNIHRPLWWINLKKLWQLSLYQSRFYIWRAHTLTWEICNDDEQKSRFWKSYYFFIVGTFYPSMKPFRKLNKSHLKDFNSKRFVVSADNLLLSITVAMLQWCAWSTVFTLIFFLHYQTRKCTSKKQGHVLS